MHTCAAHSATMLLQSVVHNLIRLCIAKCCVEHAQVAAQGVLVHFLRLGHGEVAAGGCSSGVVLERAPTIGATMVHPIRMDDFWWFEMILGYPQFSDTSMVAQLGLFQNPEKSPKLPRSRRLWPPCQTSRSTEWSHVWQPARSPLEAPKLTETYWTSVEPRGFSGCKPQMSYINSYHKMLQIGLSHATGWVSLREYPQETWSGIFFNQGVSWICPFHQSVLIRDL